jgi:hypothetical protein
LEKKNKKKIYFLKKLFNIIFGTLIFALLMSSAFAIDWIFGIGFIFSFFLAIWNKILEKNSLIPAFIFVGALIIRYALFVLLPNVLNSQNYFSLGISLVLFLLIFIIGWKLKKGKFKF